MAVTLAKKSIELGIITTNPEAMLEFYRDTLGLTYERTWEMPTGTMYRLICGDCIIKLVTPNDPPPAKAQPGGVRGSTGYRYWTIFVTDLTQALDSIRDAGYAVVVPETEIAPGVKMGFVEDPDGNWLELVSIPA